ncbi:hypothetical protein ACZ90_65675 [Streptomyces albus subsp. albus]|nr:hypothetical protein ACZ90_65675 [Streptomyces albus subsp. albus]
MVAKKTASAEQVTPKSAPGRDAPSRPDAAPRRTAPAKKKTEPARDATVRDAAPRNATDRGSGTAPAKKAAAGKAAAKAPAGKKAAEKPAGKTAANGAATAAQVTDGKSATGKRAAGSRTAGKSTAKKTAAKKTSTEDPTSAGQRSRTAKKDPTPKAPTAKKTSTAKKPATAKKTPATKAVPAAPAMESVPAKQTGASTVALKKTPDETSPQHRPPDTAGAVPKARAVAAPGELAVRAGEDPWTPAEVAEARSGLEQDAQRLRTEIVAVETAISGLMRDSGDGAGDDQADTGTKNITREHELALASSARERLLQTERALERLDAGTYGLCENCGNPIGKARMQAFPRATLCVECKQRQERR